MAGKNRGTKSAKKRDEDNGGAELVVLLAVGAAVWVIVKLIWWIAAAALLAVAALGVRAIVRAQLRRREAHSTYQAAMVARADQQYEWALSGDARGIYGTADARLIEPPRPCAGKLNACIAGLVTVALVGAFLLVHHPSLSSTRKGESAQTTVPFSDLDMPLGVAAGPDGAVYVTDAHHDRVLKLAAGATEQVVLPFPGLSFPESIAVDGRGDVFVGGFDETTHHSTVMELRAGESAAIALPIHLAGPANGIAVDTAGAVYVVEDTSDGGLYRLAPTATGATEMLSGAFDAVAVDAWGTIYLTRGTDRPNVVKIPAGQTVPTKTAFPDMQLASGVTVDSAGNVHVSDGWASASPVYRLAAGHTSATALDVVDVSFPNSLANGVAVDNDGNLYVVDMKQSRVNKVRAPLKDASH